MSTVSKISRESAKKANRRSGAKSRKTYENLDVESQTSAAKKPENALELARRLCVLANAGALGGRDVERVREAVDLLSPRANWIDAVEAALFGNAGVPLWVEPPLGDAVFIPSTMLGGTGGEDESRSAGGSADYRADVERATADLSGQPAHSALTRNLAGVLPGKHARLWAGVLSAELQCVAARLGALIKCCRGGDGFLDERRELRWTWVDETGRVRSRPISGLGEDQDLFERALAHPGVDPRRFGYCENEKCRAFFYKPRHKSRACGRKCEDVLMSREHYWREKARHEVALKLKAQGVNLREIAAALGVSMTRVRRYITANREKRDNE